MCCDWSGLRGRGHVTHGPRDPSQALEGCGSLHRKVTWQTTSCWQKRRATLGLLCGEKKKAGVEGVSGGLGWGQGGGSGESRDLFRCKQFCSAFSFEFSFVILAKLCHRWHNHYYLFKIRSQYTGFSLCFFFFIIDYVQKCKEVNLYRPSPPDFHALPSLFCRRWRRASGLQKLTQKKETNVIKYAALFSNMAQFPGRVQISKQYFLFEMDIVENNIFTLNI